MWPRRHRTPETDPRSSREGGLVVTGGRAALSGVLANAGEFKANAEVQAFDRLRSAAYDRMGQDIVERLTLNPTPTAEERSMGTYIEALEPQMRNAVMTMRAKGYNTMASGFHGTDDDWRVLGIDNPARTEDLSNRRGQIVNFDRPLSLGSESAQKLADMGVSMLEWPGEAGTIVLGFSPLSPDLDAITAQWDAIAEALPDTGVPAGPRHGSLEATPFGVYCPPDISWPTAVFDSVAHQAAASYDISHDIGTSAASAE